jgi:hypothetical protein
MELPQQTLIDMSKKYWNKLTLLTESSDLKEYSDLLFNLREANGGWILYEEIAQKLDSHYFSDSTSEYLLRILLDAYEGGSRESGAYHIPKNNKDELIQEVMRNQLSNPKGKKSFRNVLGHLYYFEPDGGNEIFEEKMSQHPNLLTTEEKLDLRLGYASSDPEKLATIISNVTGKSDSKSVQGVILEKLNEVLIVTHNDLLNKENENLRFSLFYYLEKNPVDLTGYNKGSLDEREKLKSEYAEWVWAYGAASGEKDLDKYFYERVQEEKNSVKLLALINYQMSRIQIIDSTKEVNRILDNNEVKNTLKSALSNTNTDQLTKQQINNIMRNYYNKKS